MALRLLQRVNGSRTFTRRSSLLQRWLSVQKRAVESGMKVMQQYLNEPSLRVGIVPLLDDNYGYIVVDEANHTMFAVDPAEPSKILPILREEEKARNRQFLGILTTHKHADHAGGNNEMAKQYPGVMIVGPKHEPIPARNRSVSGGETFKIGAAKVEVLDVACHTKAHVAYVVTGDNETPPLLFPGDTLFVGGCGRFFEGTAADMYKALYDVILKLPMDTKVYCGHEYTMSNLRFALSIDPSNQALRDKIAAVRIHRDKQLPSVPSSLREEMLYNPFLRVHDETIRHAVGGSDAVSVLENLRRRKDSFT
uniref:hydroxyacylglutathione hydrolase n=1 Tax=Hyaloperonospora arabidopsidis (strain Emoy2) TaxID=559515 RepID=M4BD48_HYAAE